MKEIKTKTYKYPICIWMSRIVSWQVNDAGLDDEPEYQLVVRIKGTNGNEAILIPTTPEFKDVINVTMGERCLYVQVETNE